MTVRSVLSSEPWAVSATRRRIRAAALRPGRVGRVGLELEGHLVDLADPGRRVPWERIASLLERPPNLPGGSRLTLEPGGQVELSGPVSGLTAAIAGMRQDRRVLRRELAHAGLGLASLGADPARVPRRVHPGSRYAAMEEHFDRTGRTAAGRAMMCSTAALQVNLDAGPPQRWTERVALAHRLGPVLIAISACSPLLGGVATGWSSTRQRVWSALDPGRCGPFPQDGSPAEAWAEYALDAPVMMVRDGDGCRAVHSPVTLREWVSGRVLLCGRTPTDEDVDHHLTTLFPPVRLRGFLEIRCLDAVPDRWWPALAAATCLLLDDPVAASVADAATRPVAGAWVRAARDGLADPALRLAAEQCLVAAAAAAPEELRLEIENYAEAVAAGTGPGAAVLAQARAAGPLAALEEEAHAC